MAWSPIAVGHADDLGGAGQLVGLGVIGLQAEAAHETVVALRAHRVAGEQVQRGDLGGLAAQGRLGVLANQHAGLVVVGGEQGVGAVERAVQRNHLHALGLHFFHGRDDGIAAGGDQNGLGAGGSHVFQGGDLAGGVAVGLAGSGQQLGAGLLGFGLGAFLHLDEEGVGFGLGDQADDGLVRQKRWAGRQGQGLSSRVVMISCGVSSLDGAGW